MNLGQIIDFVGNLLDYDPTNDTYRAQLVSLINDVQTRVLTDRNWDFAIDRRELNVLTDTTVSVGVTSGSSTVTGGPFPFATSPVRPGSEYEGASLVITDSGGIEHEHTLRYVSATNTAFLDRDFLGVSGTYTATVKWRNVYLPSDTMTIQNVADPAQGTAPAKALFLSQWEKDDANLDPTLLGTVEAYLPGEPLRVPAPQTARGVSVVAGSSQGARTINVYMVNVRYPLSTPHARYRGDVSDGFESAFSKVGTYTLTDSETLTFTPEAVASASGLYRRYYFTCPEANILAPVRIRNADDEGAKPELNVDTVPPTGGVTLYPDLSLATLESQAFQALSVRYLRNQAAAYTSIQLYPHPSANQKVEVRATVAPAWMEEDQDSPLIPAAYSQVLAYAALEHLTLKVGNTALSQVFMRKKDQVFRQMEGRYLTQVPRRIVKGTPAAGHRYLPNMFGPLSFTP